MEVHNEGNGSIVPLLNPVIKKEFKGYATKHRCGNDGCGSDDSWPAGESAKFKHT